jgi:hypothetical protein
MNTDTLILRETDNLPLTNKNDFLDNADFDGNIIKIYNDFLSLLNSDFVDSYDVSKTYNLGDYVIHDNKLWISVSTDPFSNIAPGTNYLIWQDRFPTVLAHIRNRDTKLADGTSDEVTASEIRAFIDAGLTSTTNLAVSENTSVSLKITSSTGTDALLTTANANLGRAGLLSAFDKIKLNNTSGVNTGDQTLASLGAEAVANKATNFNTINNTLYPTVEAVSDFLTAGVGDAVTAFVGTNYALKRLPIGADITSSRNLVQADESKVFGVGAVGGTTPIVITLPNDDTEAIAVGSQFMFYLIDDGVSVTFTAEVESPQIVEVISAGDLVAFDTIGAVATLVKVATNKWLLTGKLS